MILITGAAGKTGRAVLKALVEHGETVRVLVRRQEQAEELIRQGASAALVGEMTEPASYREAMEGVNAAYHICPNVHPEEVAIGRLAIESARKCGLEHFVYHSVLHSQVEKMPHHWKKMKVEEILFESGLRYTVLQPAPYMQNILAVRDSILKKGIFPVPYPVETKLSFVDLADLGRAAAIVLTEPGYKEAVFEIVGTRAITQAELAALLSKVLEQPVAAEEVSGDQWREAVEKEGVDPLRIDTLLKMFEYYARYGLSGNSYTLTRLLGREPHTLTSFIAREFARH